MKISSLIRELSSVLESNGNMDVVIGFQNEDFNWSYQDADLVVPYEDGSCGIVGHFREEDEA